MSEKTSQKWNKVRLDDVAIITDCPHSTPKWAENGVFSVRNFNLSNGRIIKEKVSYVDEETYTERTRRAVPKKGDIIFSREAPIGSVGYVNTNERLCLGQRVVLIQPKPNIDSRFLLYQLLSENVQNQFKQSEGTGSTVSNVRIPVIKGTEISYTKLELQKVISSIIASYDHLIENHARRIKILEETAHKMYTEWFVNFRFPGHEKAKMGKDGFPEGWKEMKLDDCIFIYRGKSYSSEDLIENEKSIPFVNLKCIKRFGGFRKDGVKPFSGSYKEHQKVQQGDLVMAVTDMTQERMIVARIARIPYLGVDFGVISMDLVKIEPKENCEKDFLYAYFRWSDFSNNVKNHANGANVLHLTPNRITDYTILCPPITLQKMYSELAVSLFDEIDSIQLSIENLQKTRDLLIPQLVTGKLEVKI